MNELITSDSTLQDASSAPAPAAVEIVDSVAGMPVREDDSHLPYPPTISAQLNWLDNRWAVLGLLLTTGPIGLPALWLSRKFTRGVKIFVTLLFLLVTVALPLGLMWYWCSIAIAPLVDMFHDSRP
jgi:hypothetical protein